MMKAYPEYKDSGIEWLGEIPVHWNIHSLKRAVGKCTNGIWGEEPDGINDLVVLRVADFDRNALKIVDDKLTKRAISLKERNTRQLRKGDLLLEKSGGGEKTLVGCTVLFDKDYEAVTSNFVAKMTPLQGFNSAYLNYAFSHLYAGNVNYPSINQTTGIQNIDSESYLLNYFSFPSAEEQAGIARYLEIETARIDNLIAEKENFIKLLQEKRQALISHVVTKGLNPNVPMKDSGVEWIGKIPEHWESIRNKFVFKIFSGYAFKGEFFEKNSGDENLLVTPGTFTESGEIYLSKKNKISYQGEVKKEFKLKNNDLVMVLTDLSYKKLILGRAAFIKGDNFLLNQRIARVDKVSDCNRTFLWYYLNSNVFREQIVLTSTGATVYHTSNDKVANSWIPLPDISEQKKLVKFLDEKTKKLDNIIKEADKSIELLKEHRTALISAAVTGKIDVREEA